MSYFSGDVGIHWCLLLGYDREDLWYKRSQVIKQASQLLLQLCGTELESSLLLRQGNSSRNTDTTPCLYFPTFKTSLIEKLPTLEAAR